MPKIISIIINLGIPGGLIILALLTGTIIEKRHYQSIDKREKELAHIALLNGRKYPDKNRVTNARFVSGSVVISYDYFKRFLASLRMIFGGEVKSYASLLYRGRREAILRMKEKCRDADLIINLRIDTSSISMGTRKKGIGSIEVFAYGTAIYYSEKAGS